MYSLFVLSYIKVERRYKCRDVMGCFEKKYENALKQKGNLLYYDLSKILFSLHPLPIPTVVLTLRNNNVTYVFDIIRMESRTDSAEMNFRHQLPSQCSHSRFTTSLLLRWQFPMELIRQSNSQSATLVLWRTMPGKWTVLFSSFLILPPRRTFSSIRESIKNFIFSLVFCIWFNF